MATMMELSSSFALSGDKGHPMRPPMWLWKGLPSPASVSYRHATLSSPANRPQMSSAILATSRGSPCRISLSKLHMR
eukprot:7391462-Prymnesium_polylepis.1